MYRNEAQMVVELSGLSLIGHSVLTELNGFIVQHELIELINSLVHVGHIKLFKLSRLIVHSSSEGSRISKLIVDFILIPSSEGARRAALKLIVESTIVFELAGVCLARNVSHQTSQIDWRTFHCIKLCSSFQFMQHTPLVDC